MKNEEVDRIIEEIKWYNLMKCFMLYHAASVEIMGFSSNENVELLNVAGRAIKINMQEQLFPKNICEDDLREIFPHIGTSKSKWKNNFMNKFCALV